MNTINPDRLAAMGERRREVIERILGYRLLAERITDPQTLDAIRRLIEELEAQLKDLPSDS
ncbi:hypothetical protein JQ604_39485 [Bradyrhizobium jicamae]|uniref:hypothetical protein n=1 Tax=Bradyrhizobium jicamae TaxID=280332 RepID=UPI001BA8A7BF|nr:hypothetical protein [Bradyrhizobium jicamae]MBR0758298.1 hypothetical protein [Bradyrhizobium jicamae]